jgi:hypothetical protein
MAADSAGTCQEYANRSRIRTGGRQRPRLHLPAQRLEGTMQADVVLVAVGNAGI